MNAEGYLLESNDAVVLVSGKALGGQITKSNTEYIVQDAFNLRGGSITIPGGCTLSFNGGKILNGTIIGNNTVIKSTESVSLFSNIKLEGSWCAKVGFPEWFGAVGNGRTDDRDAVQKTMSICDTIVLSKNYLIHNAPFDYKKYKKIPDDELNYYLDVLAQKNRTSDAELTPLMLSSNKVVVITGSLKAYSPLGTLLELRGNNTEINGGGTISGCGVVNTVNVYSGKPRYAIANWESALIYIKGSNNRIENLTIKDPTRQGISIYDYLSKGNIICNCVIGGGLKSHTKDISTCDFSGLFGICARGTNTIVKDNVFKKLDGRSLYDALYCDYTTINVPDKKADRTAVHTVFENNVVESALEHGVYTYVCNLEITGNTITADDTALQLFNGGQHVTNNTIHCNRNSSGIFVSGENQVIKNNKIYNVGRYGIRCTGYYNGSCDHNLIVDNYIEKLMVPFSNTQANTSPAITFESMAFRDNKLNLNKITCEGNTVKCIGEAKAARTIPIVGIIAVYGDANSSFKEIAIRNNTVLNSNVANNIAITLLNKTRTCAAYIDGNTCVNAVSIHSSIPYDPVLLVQGVKSAFVTGNRFEQQGTLNGVNNAGSAFMLEDVDQASFTGNDMRAQMYANNQFFGITNVSKLEIDGSNVINGCKVEQVIDMPGNSTDALSLQFALPQNHSRLEVVPVNRAARRAKRNNPLLVENQSIQSVQLRHERANKRQAQYRVKVVYY